MSLGAQVYLGERWELVLTASGLRVRAYAPAELLTGAHQVELPAEALWIF
jgi:hypothetical protein